MWHVLVPAIVKGGWSQSLVFLANFDSEYSLLKEILFDDISGRNSIRTEPQQPVRVPLSHFWKDIHLSVGVKSLLIEKKNSR